MSHFSVLVTGDDVTAALQPYHEFECTGTNDKYVQDVDKTEEVRTEFSAATRTMLRDSDGKLHSPYDDSGNYRAEFSKPVSSASIFDLSNRRELFIPPGYEEVEVPTSEVESFAKWVKGYYGLNVAKDENSVDRDDEHKRGYVLLNADGSLLKAVKRTNPNKKWDWWVVGGRWSNRLTFKDGAKGDTNTAGNVDWDGMVAENAENAGAEYDKIVSIIAGREMPTWASLLARKRVGEITIDEARALYNENPVYKELIAADAIDWFYGAEKLDGVLSAPDRATYVKQQSEHRSCMFALLHNGEWITAGDMGWFGMSSDTPDSRLEYAAKFFEVVRALPADTRVTVVDCHV